MTFTFALLTATHTEHMLGGASPNERVPMIVALHAMHGDPAYFLEMFQGYRGRARLILPHGRNGVWFDSFEGDVTRETERLAAAIKGWVAERPTVGKPIIVGFSQGGMMAFAIAVTHPSLIAAAVPISGLLPPSLYPSATPRVTAPIFAFHGAADLAVPTKSARASVEALKAAGYPAVLREYKGLAHDISPEEIREIMKLLREKAGSI